MESTLEDFLMRFGDMNILPENVPLKQMGILYGRVKNNGHFRIIEMYSKLITLYAIYLDNIEIYKTFIGHFNLETDMDELMFLAIESRATDICFDLLNFENYLDVGRYMTWAFLRNSDIKLLEALIELYPRDQDYSNDFFYDVINKPQILSILLRNRQNIPQLKDALKYAANVNLDSFKMLLDDHRTEYLTASDAARLLEPYKTLYDEAKKKYPTNRDRYNLMAFDQEKERLIRENQKLNIICSRKDYDSDAQNLCNFMNQKLKTDLYELQKQRERYLSR